MFLLQLRKGNGGFFCKGVLRRHDAHQTVGIDYHEIERRIGRFSLDYSHVNFKILQHIIKIFYVVSNKSNLQTVVAYCDFAQYVHQQAAFLSVRYADSDTVYAAFGIFYFVAHFVAQRNHALGIGQHYFPFVRQQQFALFPQKKRSVQLFFKAFDVLADGRLRKT